MWIYDVQTMRFLAVNDAAVDGVWVFRSGSSGDVCGHRGGQGASGDWHDGPNGRPVVKRTNRHRRADGTAFDVDVTDHDMVFEGARRGLCWQWISTERETLHRELGAAGAA